MPACLCESSLCCLGCLHASPGDVHAVLHRLLLEKPAHDGQAWCCSKRRRQRPQSSSHDGRAWCCSEWQRQRPQRSSRGGGSWLQGAVAAAAARSSGSNDQQAAQPTTSPGGPSSTCANGERRGQERHSQAIHCCWVTATWHSTESNAGLATIFNAPPVPHDRMIQLVHALQLLRRAVTEICGMWVVDAMC